MNPDGSITLWLDALRDREADAAGQLWDRYFRRMLALARQKLGETDRGVFDEEDVALSAFRTFCHTLQDGGLPDLKGRDDLWLLLAKITARKAISWQRRQNAKKRTPPGEPQDVNKVVDGQPFPDVQIIMAEECQRLIGSLEDPDHVQVATLKLDGFSNEEIADRIGYTRRTVQRMLVVIRETWSELIDEPDADV